MVDKTVELARLILDGGSSNDVRLLAVHEIECALASNDELNEHPLGFFHLGLADIDDLGRLRLHVWLPYERPVQNPPWMIHRHVSDLHSHILSGSVVNRIYDVSDATSCPTNKLYGVKYDSGNSLLFDLKVEVECKEVSSKRYVNGESYSLRYDEYHSTVVSRDAFVVTVAVFASETRNETRVVGQLSGDPEYRYERRRVGVDYSQEILQRVRKVVGNST